VFYLGASLDVDDLPRQFSAQEQIQHEQGVQGDTNVAARWSWKKSVWSSLETGIIPGYALLVLAHSRRQCLKRVARASSGNTRLDRLEIMTQALHLQYRVDHPHVFGRPVQEGNIVH
jgi:hypothetical protein